MKSNRIKYRLIDPKGFRLEMARQGYPTFASMDAIPDFPSGRTVRAMLGSTKRKKNERAPRLQVSTKVAKQICRFLDFDAEVLFEAVVQEY